MPMSAAAAANIMLDAAEERGLALDPMKLQKLLYLTNGYYLGLSNQPWIRDSFEAWKYGPVIPSIYHKFKQYGSDPIDMGRRTPAFPVNSDDENLQKALNFVLDKYGSKRSTYLSELTHKVGSPWHKVWEKDERNTSIPNDEIKSYFSKLIKSPKK